MRVKIIGAGSIGNHMAHASRELGWDVTVVDLSHDALIRMRDDIYPSRYGAWDPTISLRLSSEAPNGKFDLVIIGTPPDQHLTLAIAALADNPKAILIEKPLCPPSLEQAQTIFDVTNESPTKCFVGYDHVVGKAARAAADLVRSNVIGDVITIDVEFREHWAGIFKAHPWLRGPEDTYLGFTDRGGGASGEHSHALNLWQHFAHVAGAGRVVEVDGVMKYVSVGKAHYDEMCFLTLRTEEGLVGRVVQDVVTLPPKKLARLQGTEGSLEWINGYDTHGDAVLVRRRGGEEEVHRFPKRRTDDFLEELKHVLACLESNEMSSDIRLERGLDTVLTLAAAHRSERDRTRIRLDYSKGYSCEALLGLSRTTDSPTAE